MGDYKNKYMNTENAASRFNDERYRDYVLYHAIQEDKRLCVGISVKDRMELTKIKSTFNDVMTYITTDYEGSGELYLEMCRKGCLNDFYSYDQIIEEYEKNGVFFDDEEKESIKKHMGYELLDLMSGRFFDYKFPTATWNYAIIGMMFGYPIDITAVDILEH
ncbi:MAG: hypothetical protein E7270_04785 [Lachnospiraceae bacterium]|nr:hypothetical protein [Lachnospiraceae bacterium]